MTIYEAITRLDGEKHNTCPTARKIAWLSQLDAMVKTQILSGYEEGDSVCCTDYCDTTPGNLVLLVPAPFDEMYLRWLEARVDYESGEIDRYNNAMDIFHALWDAYRNHYNATHRARNVKISYM